MLPNMHNEMVSPMPLGNIDTQNVPGEYSMNDRGDVSRFPEQGNALLITSADHFHPAAVTRHHDSKRFP